MRINMLRRDAGTHMATAGAGAKQKQDECSANAICQKTTAKQTNNNNNDSANRPPPRN